MKRIFSIVESIFLVLLLIIFWLNHNKIYNSIPDKIIGINTEYILCTIFLIFMLYESYRDIKNFEYTTKIYIIIADMIKIITFLFLIFLFTNTYDKSNVDLAFARHRQITWVMILISFIEVMKSFIKNDRFLKNAESDILENENNRY